MKKLMTILGIVTMFIFTLISCEGAEKSTQEEEKIEVVKDTTAAYDHSKCAKDSTGKCDPSKCDTTKCNNLSSGLY
jgi:hypothetical protein